MHPAWRRCFSVTNAQFSPLVCRLVNGRVTLAHRRLWPAVVRVADRFPQARLAKIVETHTRAGHHRVEETPFPAWVPQPVRTAASALGWLDGDQVVRPWHGARFCLADGRPCSGPAETPVATYPVREEGRGVFIRVVADSPTP